MKFRLFRLVYRLLRWVRRRMSRNGLIVANLTGFSAAFGLDTTANLAHALFTLGVGLLLADSLFVYALRPRHLALRACRRLPEFVTCGKPTQFQIEVENVGSRRTGAAAIEEELAQPWPEKEADAAAAGKSPPGWKSIFSLGAYPRYLQLLRSLRAADIARGSVPPLLARQTAAVSLDLLPTARGIARFAGLHLVVTGPLGLVERRLPIAVTGATLPVLPAPRKLDLPLPAGQRRLQPGGISLAQHVGESEEFRSLRDYRPGDPLRNIHWRSFARTGKPVVKEYQEEFFSRHALILDTAAPALFHPALEAALCVAAGLIARPLDGDALLDVVFVADKVHRMTLGRGLGSRDALMRTLASIQPSPPESLDGLLSSVVRHAHQVASLVVLLLAWDDKRQSMVRKLMALGLRPTVFVIGADRPDADSGQAAWGGFVQYLPIAGPEAVAQ